MDIINISINTCGQPIMKIKPYTKLKLGTSGIYYVLAALPLRACGGKGVKLKH